MWKVAFCIVSFSNCQLHYLDLISFRVEHPASGRFLEMYSTEPGVQFYTAFYLNETGKGGAKYEKFGAFCLEAQHYPDSPNKVSCRLSKIFNFLLCSGYLIHILFFGFISAKFSHNVIGARGNLSTNNYIQIWSAMISKGSYLHHDV